MPEKGLAISVEPGDASLWSGQADLVCTHPYATLPPCLLGIPAIVNLYLPPGQEEERRKRAETWVGAKLRSMGSWGKGGRNTIFVSFDWPEETPFPDISDLIEDAFQPGRGWMPVELPLRILRAYQHRLRLDGPVWDGFCGRGTIGKACQILGLDYIGLDIDPERVRIAREYLGLP